MHLKRLAERTLPKDVALPSKSNKGGTMKLGKTAEQLRRLLELRRSSASSPVKNKRNYTRKIKHKGRDDNED
jgi:hypothetical protein